MKIAISDRNSDANALANLFARNLTTSYISHSELQTHRAVTPDRWADNIEAVLRSEIEARLAEPTDQFPSEQFWQGVIEARDGSDVVSIALVTLSRAASVPFGVIEDIVVDKKFRGRGDGKAMVQWIIAKFEDSGIHRVFLESGLSNGSAHRFFEDIGFETVSVVMMRDL